MHKLILASASRHRAKILDDAGLQFAQIESQLDERSIDAPLQQADILPEDRASILAEAKAVDVSERYRDHLVIGCDQILSIDQQVLHKCTSMEEARKRLLALSGRTHYLHSAVVLVRDGVTLWRHVSPCAMTMRKLTPEFIGRHLSDVGETVLNSVGVYQIEGQGVQLFESIEGDVFSIIGLPLLPLLQQLRKEGVIDG
jgi:septum formation protein